MSQATTWGVPQGAPATPAEYAVRDQASFDALMTIHSGAARPSYLTSGLWLSNASSPTLLLYYYDGADDILVGTFNISANTFQPAGGILNNFVATTAPTINDDSADGYAVGSRWVNLTSKLAYQLVDSSVGAAVWNRISVSTDKLSAFAATSSAELAGIISDESGTGALVFANAPTLVNPIVGTQSPGDNSTKGASTAYVDAAVAFLRSSIARTTTTGGIQNTISGLSAAAKKFTVSLNGSALNVGTDAIWIRAGDASGVKTSGYLGAESYAQNTNQAGTNGIGAAMGFINSGTNAVYGDIDVTLVDATTFKYEYKGILHVNAATFGIFVSGNFTLSGLLDRFQVLSSTGGNTFGAQDFSVLTQF